MVGAWARETFAMMTRWHGMVYPAKQINLGRTVAGEGDLPGQTISQRRQRLAPLGLG